MSLRKVLLVCECESLEHQMVFTYDNDDFEEIYSSIYLYNYRNFWKRIVLGVKYIFGYKSKFGDFDNIILNPDDYQKFEEMAATLKRIKEKRDKNKK